MAINFNALPAESPSAKLLDSGKYLAQIKSAEIKTSANGTYINVRLDLQDEAGVKLGVVYDILSESDKPLMQYKLRRFIIATGLSDALINTSFELKDLCKLVVNKTIAVEIKAEKGKDGYQDKNVVNAFSDEIYYPVSTATKAPEAVKDDIVLDDDNDLPF